jgi:hypothetical protein
MKVTSAILAVVAMCGAAIALRAQAQERPIPRLAQKDGLRPDGGRRAVFDAGRASE